MYNILFVFLFLYLLAILLFCHLIALYYYNKRSKQSLRRVFRSITRLIEMWSRKYEYTTKVRHTRVILYLLYVIFKDTDNWFIFTSLFIWS
jgi:hypothetical protein